MKYFIISKISLIIKGILNKNYLVNQYKYIYKYNLILYIY